MWPTTELPAGPALWRPAKPAYSEMEFRPDTAQPSRLFQPTRENRGGGGKIPPPRRQRLTGEIRPTDHRWSAGKWLRVALGDGDSDLRQKAVGGSPRVALHDGVLGRGRVIGGRPEKGSRLALKRTLRSLRLGR
jgi:hypothetical protein